MTKAEIKRRQARLWKQWLVILGMGHPEIGSAFAPGWTAALPKIEAEPFNGEPVKVEDAA